MVELPIAAVILFTIQKMFLLVPTDIVLHNDMYDINTEVLIILILKIKRFI